MIENILKDKVIVISGGTKGIGHAIVIECVKQGANVVFAGRDKKAAEKILKETGKNKCKFVFTDLHNVNDCKKLFTDTIKYFKKVDGFVSYAGVTPTASLVDCEEKLYDEVFNINIKAAFFCCKYAIKAMQTNKKGSILLFGSAHSWSGKKNRAAYACSKGALYTLSEHIAHNYASEGILCNFITMGWTATDGELLLRKSQGVSEDKLKKTASRIIPMGRMTEPNDIVPGVLYLLSDYSSMATGSNLRITGGEYI